MRIALKALISTRIDYAHSPTNSCAYYFVIVIQRIKPPHNGGVAQNLISWDASPVQG